MRHAAPPSIADGFPDQVAQSAISGGPDSWQAKLSLVFADDHGTTRMIENSHFGPLRVQKPFYPEQASVCHAIIIHPPGGVVGGDELTITARAGAKAHALITTPGAAKWYRANGRRSRQDVHIDAAAGASIEWLPQETIFFNDADVLLNHTVSLEPDANYIGCDILCFGRTASGERFDAGRIAQRTTLRRGGKLIWFEQGSLFGSSTAMQHPLALDGKTVCATLIAAGRPVPSDLLQHIREQAAGMDDGGGRIGATQLKSVFIARYLGDSSETAKQLITAIWKRLRPHLLEREAVAPRIWNT